MLEIFAFSKEKIIAKINDRYLIVEALVAVGESIKNLDKITNKKLLIRYSQIKWKQVMGMRDIIVHHYFDVDAEEIYKTLKEDIPLLLSVLNEIKNDLKNT